MEERISEMDLEGEVSLEITGGGGDITTLTTARCYYKNNSYYLIFQEELGDETGKDSQRFSSRLKISKDQIVLHRSLPQVEGKVACPVMEMTYRKEPGSYVNYPTPYGVLRFDIFTDSLEISKRSGELKARIAYRLTQEGQEVSKDTLLIRAWK